MVHLDLDGAWPADEAAVTTAARIDARDWGARLRYCAPPPIVEAFTGEIEPQLHDPFLLYGSGDYHYLSGLWLRRMREPFTLVSFDNHPDWDWRPPHWGCGGWLNRALERPLLRDIAVWGCGNFELNWPNRLFANHQAMREERLRVFAWAERFPRRPAGPWRFITREAWRAEFARFAEEKPGRNYYVTIDCDCLDAASAATNWENGLFTPDDLVWALGTLRASGTILGGDLCGAWSEPAYARWTQAFAGRFDHPKLEPRAPGAASARELNAGLLRRLLPALG